LATKPLFFTGETPVLPYFAGASFSLTYSLLFPIGAVCAKEKTVERKKESD
jgi:hypothetical protein